VKALDAALATLIERFGFRVSSTDARAAAVPEILLLAAVGAGRARIERMHFAGAYVGTTYIIFQ
jgi:hypothetical protein